MINLLKTLELNFYNLLHPSNRGNWKSLDIVYEEPHVKRLWLPVLENHRLCIHEIHKCILSKPLKHPHEWPSAMKIGDGIYKMNLGDETNILATMELHPGSYYEMLNYKAYHSVFPETDTVLTVMLMGNIYKNPLEFPKPNKKQKPLCDNDRNRLFNRICNVYDLKY